MKDLTLVLAAPDERVEVDPARVQDRQLPRGRNEDTRPTRLAKCRDITADEVRRVGTRELLPGEVGIVAARDELRPQHGDRPLGGIVEKAEGAPLRLGRPCRVHRDAAGGELSCGCRPQLVAAERRVERGRSGQRGKTRCGDSPSPGRLLPRLGGVDDLSGFRDALHTRELHPLDVSDNGDFHVPSLTPEARSALIDMMDAVHVPPFERFYLEHRDGVLTFLRRRLPHDAAEDAFQETFLRALRAYGRLAHAENLTGWIFTIARRVAIDSHRPLWTGDEVEDLESIDAPPAYEELQELTGELPPKERAAVVLRYGYDLPYATIGDALGSSAEAARQAASSGVRRLRTRRNDDRKP
jgi:RNA polymerase sigma factor (sigma-70 family)